ncbi:hypothetical protein Hanom_Chr03g00197011 [Helianthus anomalus]
MKDKGKTKIVEYSESDDDEDKGDDDDEEKEDSDFRDIDNYKEGDNDDDDHDHGGDGMQVVKSLGDHQVLNYLDDTQNEENGSGATHDEESAGIFTEAIPINSVPADTPKVIYLCHDVE